MKTGVAWKGKTIVDELCACGHFKSEHNGAVHHLGCTKDCSCGRFTWKAFVYSK